MTQLMASSYHYTTFDHVLRRDAVTRVTCALRRFPRDVGIVCTGLSGILIAVPAAEKTGREFAIVRKAGESTHSLYRVEGHLLRDYVIVDDFIDRGYTMQRIMRLMNERNFMAIPKCRGILLYGGSKDQKSFTYKREKFPVIQLRLHQ